MHKKIFYFLFKSIEILKLTALKKFTLLSSALFFLTAFTLGQKKAQVLDASDAKRCVTMELMEEAIKKDPGLPAKWKLEGEKQYNAYLQRQMNRRETEEAAEIIIPVVFHLVDDSTKQTWITDRDIYEQIEILNKTYSGEKAGAYKNIIPKEMYSRLGRVPVKFVLARRTPSGALTSGIERRVNASPDHISIKSFATGGIDAWDVKKYVNVWAGTFSGEDEGILGIATFPFTTGEGPQGVVIGTATLPYASNVSRGYYPAYSEGATLAHEIGHYFYLWHTFGDATVCNNDDFRIQEGWDLPEGAGPEGDDTPDEKAGPGNAYFGNPSQNYSDGCTSLTFGMMYGSFLNYFDDRALFMFSDGHRKRVEGCIELYRPELKTSNGAIAPVAVTDAFLVTATPRGLPERRELILNNAPLTVTVRNSGTGVLNSVTVNMKMDGNATVSATFDLSLDAGKDTLLNLGKITGAAGAHVLTISTFAPNGVADMFPENDALQSFVYITSGAINAPFTEAFTSTTFPPEGWQIWNPQENTTWIRNTTSGYTTAGAATVQNYNYNGGGQLDELLSPAINLGGADSALLQFKIAYGVSSITNVSEWDGLEAYVSNNGGVSYELAYKKTGNQLKTITAAQTASFTALPSTPEKWRNESINLTPFIIPGNKILIKFRNVNAYGNNIYLDDIEVSVYTSFTRDAFPISILNIPDYLCSGDPVPSISFGTNGKVILNSLKVNYSIDNSAAANVSWTGSLSQGGIDTVSLPALTSLTTGAHTFTVYTSTPNGLIDENVTNDTIRKTFYVIGKVNSPVTEGFETVTFPPATWAIDNLDGELTWEKATNTASAGTGSMVINNFDQPATGTNDKFISSIVTGNAEYDSVFVSFDYANAPGINYPGSTREPLDTLEIMVTTDCGQTLITVWKKWGYELQTISNPNHASGTRFTPNANEWKNINLRLFPIVGNNDFQVYFVAKSNKQNNLYIDNINIYGKTVPARLKKQGYLIYPSPFKAQFIIRNYEEPATLQSAGVYNSVGQMVWAKQLNGTAQKEITVDLAKLPAGVYTVKLNYTEKTVVERIVKQ